METEHTGKHSLSLASELRSQYNLDYLVGSVHHVNGCVSMASRVCLNIASNMTFITANSRIPIDFSEELFAQAEESAGGTEGVFATYFDHQYEYVCDRFQSPTSADTRDADIQDA